MRTLRPHATPASPSTGQPSARRDELRLGTWATLLAAAAGVIGLAAVVGWSFDVEGLRQIGHLAPMTFNAAISAVILAVTWVLPRKFHFVAAGVVLVLAGMTLAEYAADFDLGFDRFVTDGDSGGLAHQGRMGVTSAACLALVAGGRAALALDRRVLAQAAVALSGAAASVAVFGYLYGVRALYSVGPVDAMSLNSAVAVLLLSIALLASVPGGAVQWALLGPDAGPMLLRRLLPVAFLGVPVLGLLTLAGERAGWYDTRFALALMVVASTLLVTTFTWAGARELSGVDRRRLQAIAELRSLADVLEQRVRHRVEQVEAHNARIAVLEDRMQQRVAQVEAHNARIAVLEDRERIASDLHDLVVQQLFAAGMQLQGLAGVHDQETVDRRIDGVVDAIDGAIADLRASIFELRTGARELDLRTATERVINGASMGLGFKPRLTFEGPVEQAVEVRDDLIAVMREALSNVARHAAASRADVRLSVSPDEILLTITDDGVGIGEIVREGGTAHMRARAAQFGGVCRWRTNEPHGTVVEWSVPREGGTLLRGDADEAVEART